jgi:hypothetical protein
LTIRGLHAAAKEGGGFRRASPEIFDQLPFSFPVPASIAIKKGRLIASEVDIMTMMGDEIVLSPVLNVARPHHDRRRKGAGWQWAAAIPSRVSDRNWMRTSRFVEGKALVGNGPLPSQAEFLTGIECEPPASFSIFLPHTDRVLQATIMIQRAVR